MSARELFKDMVFDKPTVVQPLQAASVLDYIDRLDEERTLWRNAQIRQENLLVKIRVIVRTWRQGTETQASALAAITEAIDATA